MVKVPIISALVLGSALVMGAYMSSFKSLNSHPPLAAATQLSDLEKATCKREKLAALDIVTLFDGAVSQSYRIRATEGVAACIDAYLREETSKLPQIGLHGLVPSTEVGSHDGMRNYKTARMPHK